MKLRTILLILALLSIASISTAGYLYYASLKASVLEEARQEAISQTQTLALHIDATLSEHQKSAKALAGLKELHQALKEQNESKIKAANMMLEHFHQALNVDVCYLMDKQGNTIVNLP